MDLPDRSPADAGIAELKLSRDPLGTEGEMTPGPDSYDPYREIEEREALLDFSESVEKSREQTRKQREMNPLFNDSDPFDMGSPDLDLDLGLDLGGALDGP